MSEAPRLPLQSVSWLTFLNVFSAIFGVAQTIIVASLFGATRIIEVYFAATTFQLLLLSLTNSGQIGDLFTPLFHEVRTRHGEYEARRAFSAITNVMLLVAALTAVVAIPLAAPISRILVPGFDAADLLLCARVFRAVAPLIVVQIANSMLRNLLQAEHRYGVDESITLVSRIINLILLIVLCQHLGIWALILGLWAGALGRCIGMLGYSWRNGWRHSWVFRTSHFSPKSVLLKMPLTFQHIFASQFFSFALTAGLSYLPQGSFATYQYAKQLHAKLSGIVLRPIGIVFFNHLSESLASGDEYSAAKLSGFGRHALRLTVGIVALATTLIAVAGDLILWVLWGGEKFPPDRIHETWLILVALTAMLILNGQYLVARRTNLALKSVGRQYFVTGSVLVLAGLMCYWLIPVYGVWGAVLIQVISVAGTTFLSTSLTWFTRNELAVVIPLTELARWLAAAIVAISLTFWIRSQFSIEFSGAKWLCVVNAICLVFTSFTILSGMSLLLQIKESQEIFSRIAWHARRRFG